MAPLRAKVEALLQSFEEEVKRLWHDASVEQFGSFSTGLWLPNSDVDVVVVVPYTAERDTIASAKQQAGDGKGGVAAPTDTDIARGSR